VRYVVTGATGFIGGHVARLLLDRGDEVVAIVRDPGRAADLAEAGAELVRGDITGKESMRPAMAGADGVFHLAAWYDVGVDDTAAERVNVEGTRNVLELVASEAVPKAVYTSTLAVNSDTDGKVVDETYRYDGPHRSTYDRTKWAAHYEVAVPMMEAGLPLVVVMPGVTYGVGDTSPMRSLWDGYLTRSLPVVPRETAYCFDHVEDTARAHLQAMDRGEPGSTYIIAGEPATLTTVLALAEELTGIPAPRAVSPWWFQLLARVVEPLDGVVPIPPDYRAESLRVLAGTTYLGDNTKAKRELGLDHRPLRDGLEAMLSAELARLQ
jgi:nucleoside-diphosphate-sugar epimerase